MPNAHPQRNPVILYDMDIQWNSIAMKREPSISKMIGGTYQS
jgi:hypothetical protein